MAHPYLLKSKVKNLPLPKNHQREDLSFQELANEVKPSIVVIERLTGLAGKVEEVPGSLYQVMD